jgi:hypothetical protein
MKSQDYHCSFTADVTAEEAFDGINDVGRWWAKNFEGHSKTVHDIFTVRFGKTWVTFEVTESVPGRKVVWQVTDCYLDFISDKKEWNGTSIVFEIKPAEGAVEVGMTHVGLVPGAECFEDCQQGWNHHFGESLRKLLTEQVGLPA